MRFIEMCSICALASMTGVGSGLSLPCVALRFQNLKGHCVVLGKKSKLLGIITKKAVSEDLSLLISSSKMTQGTFKIGREKEIPISCFRSVNKESPKSL